MENNQHTISETSNTLTHNIPVLDERVSDWRQERQMLLQREQWWAHQWHQREMFFHVREQLSIQNQCQALIVCQQHGQLKCKYDQLRQDFKSYKEESKKREQVLLKLLQSERHHLIIEIPEHSYETKDSHNTEEAKPKQRSFETKSSQTTDETKPVQPLNSSGDNDQAALTFGDIPNELQFWKDPSVAVVVMVTPKAGKTKSTKKKLKEVISSKQVGEDTLQTRKWFEEKWQEREKAWEQQMSEAKLSHQTVFKIWQSLYDLRIQQLEKAAEESQIREQKLLKMLKSDIFQEDSKVVSFKEKQSLVNSEENNAADVSMVQSMFHENGNYVKVDDCTEHFSPQISGNVTKVLVSEASEKAEETFSAEANDKTSEALSDNTTPKLLEEITEKVSVSSAQTMFQKNAKNVNVDESSKYFSPQTAADATEVNVSEASGNAAKTFPAEVNDETKEVEVLSDHIVLEDDTQNISQNAMEISMNAEETTSAEAKIHTLETEVEMEASSIPEEPVLQLERISVIQNTNNITEASEKEENISSSVVQEELITATSMETSLMEGEAENKVVQPSSSPLPEEPVIQRPPSQTDMVYRKACNMELPPITKTKTEKKKGRNKQKNTVKMDLNFSEPKIELPKGPTSRNDDKDKAEEEVMKDAKQKNKRADNSANWRWREENDYDDDQDEYHGAIRMRNKNRAQYNNERRD